MAYIIQNEQCYKFSVEFFSFRRFYGLVQAYESIKMYFEAILSQERIGMKKSSATIFVVVFLLWVRG